MYILMPFLARVGTYLLTYAKVNVWLLKGMEVIKTINYLIHDYRLDILNWMVVLANAIILFLGPLLHATAVQYRTCFVPFGTGWLAYERNYHSSVALWRIIFVSSFTVSNGKSFHPQEICFLTRTYYIFNNLLLYTFFFIYCSNIHLIRV